MKTITAIIFALAVAFPVAAQNTHAGRDWFNCSFDRDGVYGAEVDKALEFLKGKKLLKKPVVALIGSGMDIEQEDLKHAIWNNVAEKPDGVDNDRNRYVDDLHGWNFLTNANGETLQNTNLTTDREYFRLRDKYINLSRFGDEYLHISDDGVVEKVGPPADLAEYEYFLDVRAQQTSTVAGRHSGWLFSYMVEGMVERMDGEMKKRYPGVELTRDHFVETAKEMLPSLKAYDAAALATIGNGIGYYKSGLWEDIRKGYAEKIVSQNREQYDQELRKADFGARARILGDNPYDLKDYGYGNPELITFNSQSQVLKAGIIAAKRDNGVGMDGIADFAELMTLVTYAEKGEPYVKDMVLAIRYALEKGADIIVLPFQSRYYSPQDKEMMYSALVQAEKQGVLVIVSVWERSADVDKFPYFPNRFMGEKELKNIMVVGISDKEGKPTATSDFGAKGVDLFAPGVNIYSTDVGDTYVYATSPQLSAGVVAGVAALVKGYYPKLTGEQIRNLLNDNVTSRKGVEVSKRFRRAGGTSEDMFMYDELCISGGIVNAYNAVVAADKIR